MISFKQFLAEAAVDKEPDYQSADVKTAINILNTHCKDALWMLETNSPLYRGDDSSTKKLSSTGFMTVDTSATERESQNTSNYYTVILDNHPKMKDFPKRSRSFICSTDKGTAEGFVDGYDGQVFVIIPYDGVKIGMCPGSDMWGVHIHLYNLSRSIDEMNSVLRHAGVEPTYASIVKYAEKLKAGDDITLRQFKYAFPDGNPDTFLQDLWKAYSPAKTILKSYTTATLPRGIGKMDREVWVGGKIVMITQSMWGKLRNAYRKS